MLTPRASASSASTQIRSSACPSPATPSTTGHVVSIVCASKTWLIDVPGGESLGSLGLLLATDAFPPTIFNADLPVAWTPTVELTAHIRANPAPGWLRCRFSTRFVSSGFLEEDGEVWDSTGRLVGQSRQLALVPRG